MAKMFPEALPREVLEDSKRSSEVQVYNALREQLDNDYHVFYSSPWLGTNPDGSEIDGEADFLVAHADKGMLSIEVKGGVVEIDQNDQWTSTDRHKFRRNIKNPVNQARSSKYQLLEKLKQSPKWQPHFICARHGVILPHSVRPSRDFRPDMPLKLFAFDTDIDHLDAWVSARFGCREDGDDRIKPLGNDGIYALHDMLARIIKLKVRLSTNINMDMKDIQLRTNEQIFIIREMEDNHRMAIVGAAGTGKTILAIEKAQLLAEENKRVLLLCFNRPLGEYLKKMLMGSPMVTATHFHQYCFDVAKLAGTDPEGKDQSKLVDDFVKNFIDSGLQEYDAVIIDEGQDFNDDWLTMLDFVLKRGQDGVLYIFYDDNQNVMITSANYIKKLPMAKHRLTRNFRNTRSIFEVATPYYQGNHVRPIGPDGNTPTYIAVANDKELRIKLAERVGSLIQAEHIQPGDIAILFPDKNSARILQGSMGFRVGQFRATDAENRNSEFVVVDTIRRFKGLESPVVLLVVTTEVSSTDELMYVGITRAHSVLDFFGQPHVINTIKNKYHQNA